VPLRAHKHYRGISRMDNHKSRQLGDAHLRLSRSECEILACAKRWMQVAGRRYEHGLPLLVLVVMGFDLNANQRLWRNGESLRIPITQQSWRSSN
jgi:hypothetical protein